MSLALSRTHLDVTMADIISSQRAKAFGRCKELASANVIDNEIRQGDGRGGASFLA